MRFYAVRSEAIHRTHLALQQLERQRSLPSRALLVAQLYGHLQCRAKGGSTIHLTTRELAAAWHLQPRQLRSALRDLEALGWLRYRATPRCTRIELQDDTAPLPGLVPTAPPEAEAAAVAQGPTSNAAPPRTPQALLLERFAALYNQHRPPSWPAYQPRGTALAARVQRAIAHAGGAEAFWALLPHALAQMPPFWRLTYPQGRSGSDCAAALFCTDRGGAGLGVEFWHVFSWSQVSPSGRNGEPTTTAPAEPEAPELTEARRLLAWDGHHWRGQGVEALRLSRLQKRRYGELLEAAGVGIAGSAALQYGDA